jgi:hypothetical protein
MCLGLPDPHPDPLVRQKYGSKDPDPHPNPFQNVTDPEHYFTIYSATLRNLLSNVLYIYLNCIFSTMHVFDGPAQKHPFCFK